MDLLLVFELDLSQIIEPLSVDYRSVPGVQIVGSITEAISPSASAPFGYSTKFSVSRCNSDQGCLMFPDFWGDCKSPYERGCELRSFSEAPSKPLAAHLSQPAPSFSTGLYNALWLDRRKFFEARFALADPAHFAVTVLTFW